MALDVEPRTRTLDDEQLDACCGPCRSARSALPYSDSAFRPIFDRISDTLRRVAT